jgi:ribonuclease J
VTDTKPVLKISALGGLGEIGMNCTVLEYGDDIVVLDCGLLFSDLEHFGVEFVIPDFTYLRERKDKVRAFVITHGHEDHIGAIPFALKADVWAPIHASGFTARLIRERLQEYELGREVEINEFAMGQKITIGPFTFTTVPVNHSIVDATAFIIDTPVGRIVHTGDFKIDETPFYGKALDLETFRKAGDEGVLLLMSDSTNVERLEHSLSERVIYEKFEQIFSQAKGLTLVSTFASNLGRIGQVMALARRLDRKVALAGRSMETIVRLGMDAGYLCGTEGLIIPLEDIEEHPRDKVIVLSTGSQGEYRSALIRVSAGEHKHVQLQSGDMVVMSSKFIPGNEKAIGRMINDLFRQGAEVMYESVHDIHVSGHATRPELKKMLEAVRPKFFIPVHGEYRHLVHHAKLARETGVASERVVIAENGDVIELTPDSCSVVEHNEELRVLVEGREGQDVTKLVLKDRRQLGETGVVFVIMVRNAANRQILSGPEIITRGLAAEDVEPKLVEQAKSIVSHVVADYEAERRKGAPAADLQEMIRVELRRFFKNHVSRKPVVLPIVLDL